MIGYIGLMRLQVQAKQRLMKHEFEAMTWKPQRHWRLVRYWRWREEPEFVSMCLPIIRHETLQSWSFEDNCQSPCEGASIKVQSLVVSKAKIKPTARSIRLSPRTKEWNRMLVYQEDLKRVQSYYRRCMLSSWLLSIQAGQRPSTCSWCRSRYKLMTLLCHYQRGKKDSEVFIILSLRGSLFLISTERWGWGNETNCSRITASRHRGPEPKRRQELQTPYSQAQTPRSSLECWVPSRQKNWHDL
jgi:hypothetical protein